MSVLGNDPLLWCWPTVPPGTGLKYQLAVADGEWVELNTRRARYGAEDEELGPLMA